MFWVVIKFSEFTEALQRIHSFFGKLRGRKPVKETDVRPDEQLAEEFEVPRQIIFHAGPMNNFTIVLHALRKFLVEKGYLNKVEFRGFGDRWLSRYPEVEGIEAVNVFSGEEVDAMLVELRSLRIC